MTVHDGDGNLTLCARAKIVEYLKGRDPAALCCSAPTFYPASLNAWLTLKLTGNKSVVNSLGGGLPVVSVICERCGQVHLLCWGDIQRMVVK